MNTWSPKTVLIVGGVAVAGAWYLKSRATQAVKDVGQAVNPVNRDNIFNRGAQAVWDQFTDGEGSIGTDIYDWLNADKLDDLRDPQ
jgi:hypothetical protein